MATRYLRGTGARNWNDTANWSETSGGAGGASVPTEADDVIFDNNSGTGTVTVNAIANMRNCTFAQTQLITLANAAYAFNIYGNWTLCSDTYLNTSFTGTGYVYLKATTSVNITSNGSTRGWNILFFDGVGGTWTNQDDMVVKNEILIYAGTWNTNDFNITARGYDTERNTNNNRIVNFGSSVIICTGLYFYLPLNISYCVVNAGTSTIICYNVIQFYNSQLLYSVELYTGSIFYSGTFNNLKLQSRGIGLRENQIVLDNLIISGNDPDINRLVITSNIVGTPRTITCNGTVTASNVDFRDIVGAGTANWDLSAIEGGSGDCGGNSGITFTPAQTQYFKHNLGNVNWSDATKWFSNYERTIAGRVPLPQDDAIFDENSFTGASTLNVNVPRIGGLNMDGVNTQVTCSLANAIEVYGSYVLGENITQSGNFRLTLSGRANNNIINTYSKTLFYLSVNCSNGFYTNLSDIVTTSIELGFYVISGGIDLNDFNLTSPMMYINSFAMCKMGNGIIKLTSTTQEVALSIGLLATIFSENSLIIFYPASGNSIISFDGSGKSFNKIQFSGSHTGTFNITGSNTIAELIIDSGRKVRFTAGSTQTVSKFKALGTPTNPIKIDSTTTSRFNLVKTGSEPNECNFIDISNSNASPSGSWPAGYNSNDMGNNAGWEFNTDDFVPQIINL